MKFKSKKNWKCYLELGGWSSILDINAKEWLNQCYNQKFLYEK